MGEDKVRDRASSRARLPRRDLLGPRRAPGVQAAPVREEDPRGRQARRVGRQDDPLRRLLGRCRASWPCPACASPATRPGMVNIPELKGIHYAMHAGMYAAEAIVDALKQDSINFEAYDKRARESVIGEDIYRSRNMRQPFSKGFFVGGAIASAMTITGGAFPGGHWSRSTTPSIEMVIDGDRARTTRSPTASTRSTSSRRCSRPATRPATTRRTTSASRARAARGGPDVGVDVPGAGVRDPRGPARGAARNGEGDGTVDVTSVPRRTACSAGRSPPRAGA